MIEVLPNVRFTAAPLFALCAEVRNRNEGVREQNLLSLSYGNIVRKDIATADGLLPESFDGYNITQPGDTVLRLTDLQNDQRSLRTGFVRERGIITSAYVSLRPNPAVVDPRFLAYSLHALDVTKVFYGLGGGLRQSMGFEDLKRLGIPLPSLEEQQRIADFLDDQTTRIDQIVAARQEQLALLAALETSELDDLFSGPPQQLGFLLAQSPCYGVLVPQFVDDGGVPFIRVNDLSRMPTSTQEALAQIGQRQSAEYRRTVTSVGDVLVSVVGSTDKAAVVTPEFAGCNVARAVARLVPRADVPPRLLLAWTRSSVYRDHARLATGSDTAQPTLNMSDLKKFPVCLPEAISMAEVTRRADRISQSAQYRRAHLALSIELLQELKRSLISAAVSGAFDVAAASGPGVEA